MWTRLVVALLLRPSAAETAPSQTTITCTTNVDVGDGKLVIEMWDQTAPIGVERVVALAESGFLDGLPFFRAIAGFLIQFGISPDSEKQARVEAMGNIKDDPPSNIPFTDGVVSFAGYGKDSRGSHLFLTLGNQPGLGKSPWEVPVGKVVAGLDVMRKIYTGSRPEPQMVPRSRRSIADITDHCTVRVLQGTATRSTKAG